MKLQTLFALIITFVLLMTSISLPASSSAAGGGNDSITPTEMKSRDPMLRYLQNQRDNIALVSYTADTEGNISADAPVIKHNADEPMPLASTIKTVVLAAYVQQVEQGRLDPNEMIPISEWEKYYLPWSDGFAHFSALKNLGIPHDDLGFAADPSMEVPLDALARAMIAQSDNAATDYLLKRIGSDAVQEVIDQAALEQQEMPVSFLGLFLSWLNHESPEQDLEKVERLAALNDEEYLMLMSDLEDRYINDVVWREATISFWGNLSSTNYPFFVAAGEQLTPQGTANEYARIMASIVSGTFISPEVSARMRGYLEWPMQAPSIQENFVTYGAKGGSFQGLITYPLYAIPKNGDYAGQSRIVVLFMTNMPQNAFISFSQTAIFAAFERRIATDASFAEHVQRAFE